MSVAMREQLRGVLGPASAAVSLVLALVCCGGEVRSEAAVPEDPSPSLRDASPSPEAPTTCAAGTSACSIAAGLPSDPANTNACTACVSESICGCDDLNSQHWRVPTSCDAGEETCTADGGSLPSNHACQVAAVATVNCMVTRPAADCRSPVLSPNVGGILPIGMALALYDCAVCTACASECSGSPNFDAWCR
jgi:hypothetical protein